MSCRGNNSPSNQQRRSENYGEQILHIAEANVIQLGRLMPKVKAPSINMRATSKAEVVKALEDSFDYGMAALEEQTDQTLLQPAETHAVQIGSWALRRVPVLSGT